MANENTNIYEGFFLFPQAAAAELQGAADHIKDLLARAEAEIISFAKWDERRLAYEIKGNKRGIYFLVYFKTQGSKLVGLERDCNLSEQLLRFMVTRADLITEETIQAADGQQKLADEISLRGEKSATLTTSDTSRIESKSDLEAKAKAKASDEKKTEAKAEKPTKAPAAAPADTPAATPADTPAAAPTDTPADTPAKASTEA